MPENLLTVDQAASRLQLTAHSVRIHLRGGKLRGIKRGREWRVPESALFESSQGSDGMTNTVEHSKVETSGVNDINAIAARSPLATALALAAASETATKERGTRMTNAASDLEALREERFSDAR